ncbi:MAG: amidohydrolase [Bacteroidales bacterium]|nr:amidohydrolase [Bacteroidales bacterium]
MERLLLKGVLLDGRTRNILIEDKRFKDLDAPVEVAEAKILDASGTAILPALYNTHTHAAMTLLRGYADDMPLMKWLQEYIWPFEEKLTPEDVRHGSEIAIKEMVQSGTVFFNDMYFDVEETIDAVDRTGMRAAIGITVMENHSKTVTEGKKEFIRHWQDPTGGRIRLVMAPHAIYTVGARKLRDCAEFAREHGMLLHIHLSETMSEVEGCQREHGTTPVRYLDSIGFLGPDVIAAHCVHVDDEEAAILAERGVTVSHNPCSNMKLSSGVFPYRRMMQAGCRLTLGTDGASSGNNLDLREAMKFAALLAKAGGDPELLPAEEIFRWATRSGAEAFGIDAGVIAEGKLADCLLIDLSDIRMQPCHHLVSNFVYSADSRCIKHVFCDGRIIL